MSSKNVSKQETGPSKVISQKEYLKKYLSNDSSSKKKKKKKIAPASIQRSKIVNDDLDLKNMQLLGENELDLFQLDEDAPQIAGIIDERPPELQTLETYRNSKRWKVISESDELTVSDKYAEAEEKKKLNSINNREVARRFISHSITIEKPSGAKNSEFKSKSERGSSETVSESQHCRKVSKFDSSKPFQKSKHKRDSDESPPRSRRKPNSGNDSDLSPARPPRKCHQSSDSDLSPPRPSESGKARNDSNLPSYSRKHPGESRSKSDRSPRGSSKRYESGNLSPPRSSRRHKSSSDSDHSPVRTSRKHKSGNVSDPSPPRSKKHKSGNDSDSDLSPSRPSRKFNGGNDSDLSPPRPSRRHKSGNDSDLSPPRPSRSHKSGNDSDLSPPRPARKHQSGNNSDFSPPRSSKKYKLGNRFDSSPQRPSGKHKSGYDSDLSPPRSKRRRSTSDSDLSPPRPSRKLEKDHGLSREKNQHGHNSKTSSSLSKAKRNFEDYKSADSRNSREDNHDRKSRFRDRSPQNTKTSSQNKMKETLSGKKAGLQDAAALKEENVKFKEKEDLAFKEMNASVSGEGAVAVVRDRRTGRRRDPQKEEEYKKKKNAANEALSEKYAVWSKGLAQVRESRQLVEEHLHEMAKPFARHADDKDLDDFLKNQEREGDPMLEYLREKKVKSGTSANEVPTYKGPYPPNRFNIRPGYRWDGVDRSNGFEKQWFNKQNERKAVSEEAYKWSTSDM